MRKLTIISVAVIIGSAFCASPPLSAIAAEQSDNDGVQQLGRDIYEYRSKLRRYLTIDKSQASLRFELQWQIVNSERFHAATGGDAERASQRLADVLEDRLRDAVGRVSAGALSERLAAIATDAADSSREPASELGIVIANLRLIEK